MKRQEPSPLQGVTSGPVWLAAMPGGGMPGLPSRAWLGAGTGQVCVRSAWAEALSQGPWARVAPNGGGLLVHCRPDGFFQFLVFGIDPSGEKTRSGEPGG